MPSNVRLLLAATCVVFVACGSSDDMTRERSESTTAELCAGAYSAGVDDIVTIAGCAFENQLNNVHNYGKASTPAALYDAEGHELAAAVRSCDEWWQATDADGVTILANAKTGEIRAHGMVHSNMPSTTLPRVVPAPITAH